MNNEEQRPQRLVIRTSPRGMSFSTVGTDGEVEYVAYTMNSSISMAANLREALRTEEILSRDYSSVLVMIDTTTLMVPIELFKQGDCEELYFHAFKADNMVAITHYMLPDLNAVALFAVNKDFRTVINDRFSHIRFMPAVAPVWNHAHHRSYTGQKEKLYCYIHHRYMEVFSFRQNRFRFCNSFFVDNVDDALFYMLSAWKQLTLVPEHDELYIFGDMPRCNELQEKAQDFLKRVYVINPIGEYNRAAVTQIKGMPYDLMTLYVRGER